MPIDETLKNCIITDCERCNKQIKLIRGTVHRLYCYDCLIVQIPFNIRLLDLKEEEIDRLFIIIKRHLSEYNGI
jgi:hypothetical protein